MPPPRPERSRAGATSDLLDRLNRRGDALAKADPRAVSWGAAGLADHVASLARLERLEATRLRRIEGFTRLHEIEAGLSRARSIDDVVDVLAGGIVSLVEAARVSYALLGPGPEEATIYRVAGAGADTGPTVIPADHASFERDFAGVPFRYNADHRSETRADRESVHEGLVRVGVLSSMNLPVRVDGQLRGTLNVGSAAPDGFDEEDRAVLCALASFMGSTLERIGVHEQLVHEARHDQLTGLIMRQTFEEILARELELARLDEQPRAVGFIDLDRFKLINDTAGHQVGDAILRDAAERFLDCLGERDILSRLGGDEFVVLLRGRDVAGYEAVCRALVAAMSEIDFDHGARAVPCSASVGWTVIDGTVSCRQEVVGAADAACYLAKDRGGNVAVQSSVHDDLQREFAGAAETVRQLRDVLDGDGLLLYGQPIRQLASTGFDAVEVLVRMRAPDGTTISPGRFVPVAERYGLIADLDRWVIRSALASFAAARRDGAVDDELSLFLNVSPSSICVEGFASDIERIVGDAGVPPERVCFEITETGTMRNLPAALDFVTAIRGHGARIALDDFGVGLSSLAQLQRIPVDVLKIDGSLVRDVDTNPLNLAMVTSVQTMASALGLATIAEHIENEAVLGITKRLHVTAGQGFHLGGPVPIGRLLGGHGYDLTAAEEPVVGMH